MPTQTEQESTVTVERLLVFLDSIGDETGNFYSLIGNTKVSICIDAVDGVWNVTEWASGKLIGYGGTPSDAILQALTGML